MAVPALDWKALWEAGQSYGEWLQACEAPQAAEMKKTYEDTEIPSASADFLQGLARPVRVLAIAEAWCGDVRRHTPVLARLCEAGAQLHLRIVDKESRPELMVRYLTNGAEAIPIFIFFNDAFTEVGYWGPRPSACKQWMARGKAAGKIGQAREKIHAFYQRDAHQSTIRELQALFAAAAAEEV